MTWDKDPDKAFPARHPREPGGLRQDILDEIADHLACAAEREEERQEEENEAAVWSRVLDRFGNPDAIARKLWWDQMWETVMREWIQTGVMVVVTIAVLAGLAMMTRLVAGVGTANDAMREAMKQVAASNEALAKAMADQRAGNEAMLKALSGIQGGGEKADALELSNIEIVVRRGSPEGPPAPEVKVKLRGPGLGENPLSVEGELDPSGRAVFERLYQGAYSFWFNDPKSGMQMEKNITLFAGKGAGEHVIVAPDIEPRPVQIDLGLPAYGDDNNQRILIGLMGTWEGHGDTWNDRDAAVVGRTGTWASSGKPETLGTFTISGNELAVSEVELQAIGSSGDWTSQGFGAGHVEITHQSDDAAGSHFSGTLSEKLLEAYTIRARLLLNLRNVPEDDQQDWLAEWAAVELTDLAIVGAGRLPEVRLGEVHDGAVYGLAEERLDETSIMSGGGETPATVVVVGLPTDAGIEIADAAMPFLAVGIHPVQRFSVNTSSRAKDVSGNVLSAYVLRGDWRATPWPQYQQDGADGMDLTVGESPFWQIASQQISPESSKSFLQVPLDKTWFAEGAKRPTGILLRWEQASADFVWSLSLDEQIPPRDVVQAARAKGTRITPDFSIRWMVTAPLDGMDPIRADKPLTDIENGRVHYDAEVGEAVVSTPSAE